MEKVRCINYQCFVNTAIRRPYQYSNAHNYLVNFTDELDFQSGDKW